MKKGFFVSAPYEEVGAGAGAGTAEATGAEGGLCIKVGDGLVGGSDPTGVDTDGSEVSDRCMLESLDNIWLLVGVVSCGVCS